MRDSGVRALLIRAQRSQTETDALQASPLYHQAAGDSSIRLTARRQGRRGQETGSLYICFCFVFCKPFVHFIRTGSLAVAKMMSMNSKQPHFAMHPTLPEHKYTTLHSSSEAIRRACLQAPQVNEQQTSLVLARFLLRAPGARNNKERCEAHTALMFFLCIPRQSSARL